MWKAKADYKTSCTKITTPTKCTRGKGSNRKAPEQRWEWLNHSTSQVLGTENSECRKPSVWESFRCNISLAVNRSSSSLWGLTGRQPSALCCLYTTNDKELTTSQGKLDSSGDVHGLVWKKHRMATEWKTDQGSGVQYLWEQGERVRGCFQ